MSQATVGRFSRSIALKAIVIMIVIAIGYQYYISNYVDDDIVSPAHFTYGVGALITGLVAFTVSRRYRGSPVFGKTYFALGMGLSCYL